jgi:hypothetical protein
MKWEEVPGQGMNPWMAKLGELILFVQPYYGDGIKWRGIIQHDEWTLTLKKIWSQREDAQVIVEMVARNTHPLCVYFTEEKA